MHSPVFFLLPFLLADTSNVVEGGLAAFRPLAWTFAIFPVADLVVGRASRNRPERPGRLRDIANTSYRVILYLWVPITWGYLSWSIWYAGHEADALRFAALSITMAGIGAVGAIAVGHELMHSGRRIERAMAELLLTAVLQPHFVIQHILGHHAWVATPKDPESARRGESLYHFYPRAIIGGVLNAVQLERRRVKRIGSSPWTLRNRLVRFPLMLAATVALAAAIGGWKGVALLVAQAILAALFLQGVNYIEHYGLERALRPDGRYEPVASVHAWDSRHRLTNWLLFNLGRHSDHHLNARRRFQDLRCDPSNPQLPTGYFGSLMMAAVPPLWFRVMGTHLDRLRDPQPA